MTNQEIERLIEKLNQAMSQAAVEGAWQTQAKLSGIKNELLRLTRND